MFKPEIAFEEQIVYNFTYIIKTSVCVEMSRTFPSLIQFHQFFSRYVLS